MRYIFIFLISLSFIFPSSAQKTVDFDDDPSFMDRVFFGGGLGFSTNNYATLVSLSPIAGYMITQNLSAGVGVQYQYIKYKFYNVSVNNYGGNIFTRYNINQFFAQVEYNLMNMEIPSTNDTENRMYVDRMLIGGGLSQPIGSRARINIVGFYDILYQEGTPFYDSPWVFRVYISG